MRTLSKKYIITKLSIEHPTLDKEPRVIAAAFDDKELCDIHCIDMEASTLSGIYVARVDQIARNIKAVFVTIENDEHCYLPYEEVKHAIFTNKPSKKEIAIGDELLVQVVRGPMKTKLATVSTTLSVRGHYAVVSTGANEIGISKKISGDRRKELHALFENFTWSEVPMKIVVRTNCFEADNETILAEIKLLMESLETIVTSGKSRLKHTCLYKEGASYLSFINNQYDGELEEIVTDNFEIYKEVQSYLEHMKFQPAITCRYYQDEYPLAYLYSLQKHISELLNKKVWLKSGAYLIIEPTEALTVIDVNSGKNLKKDHGDYFLNINKEAGKEIIRQLNLRNISGICIIDFIDINEEQGEELLKFMRLECKNCKVPTTIVDMTRLNLCELTRKKTDNSFFEQLLRRKA